MLLLATSLIELEGLTKRLKMETKVNRQRKILFRSASTIVTITLLLTACSESSDERRDVYNIAYEYAYAAGYEGGKQAKSEGHSFAPEVIWAQPTFQMLLVSMKRKLNLSESEQVQWDLGFEAGHTAGYRDGYYGNPKKKTRFD
jgi:hypothetical protein